MGGLVRCGLGRTASAPVRGNPSPVPSLRGVSASASQTGMRLIGAFGIDRGACQERAQFRGEDPPQTPTLHASERHLPTDPLERMTDLCGVRVITQTSDQVRAVCQFLEEAFAIDRSNSEDVSQRLRPTEFGYRSVHYIVTIDAKKLQEAGVAIAVPRKSWG